MRKLFSFISSLAFCATGLSQSGREFVVSYDTWALFSAATIDAQHDSVFVKGYAVEGDGGGGLFVWTDDGDMPDWVPDSDGTSVGLYLNKDKGAVDGIYVRDLSYPCVPLWLSPTGSAATSKFIYDPGNTDATNTVSRFAATYGDATGRWVKIGNDLLGTMATQDADSVAITGGSITGVTLSGSDTFTTLSALSTLDGTTVSTVYVTDELQEGLFRWAADASVPDWVTDPDGTEAGMYYDESTTTDGCWYRADVEQLGHINVKWLGAKGDNSTDDSTALQTALDLAFQTTANPAGENTLNVFVPRGRYIIGTPLTLIEPSGGTEGYNPMWIYGIGQASVLRANWSTSQPMLYLKDCDRVNIRDIQFICSGQSSAPTSPVWNRPIGIMRDDANYWVHENVYIQGGSIGLYTINPTGNYGTIRGGLIVYCGLGWLGSSCQAGAYTDMRFGANGCGYLINGLLGARLFLNDMEDNENLAGNPYSGWIRQASSVTIDCGYMENNGVPKPAVVIAKGYPVTCSGTISGTTVTLTPTDGYTVLRGGSVILVESDSADATVQSDVEGTRTITAPAVYYTNYFSFTADSAVTPALVEAATFTVTQQLGNADASDSRSVNVQNVLLFSDTTPPEFGSVSGARVWATGNAYDDADLTTMWTDKTTDLDVHIAYTHNLSTYNSKVFGVPINIFPDPYLLRGDVAFEAAVQTDGGYYEAVTTPVEKKGYSLKFHNAQTSVPDRETTASTALQLTPLTSSIAGKDIWLGFALYFERNDPQRPIAGSITGAGTGYTNGIASATIGGRTVWFNITEDGGGGLDSVEWRNGYSEGEDASSITIEQPGSGNDATYDVATWYQSGWGNTNNAPYVTARLRHQGLATTQVLASPSIRYPTDGTADVNNWQYYGARMTMPAGMTDPYLQIAITSAGGVDGSEVLYLDNLVIVDVTDLPNPKTKVQNMEVVTPEEWTLDWPTTTQAATPSGGLLSPTFVDYRNVWTVNMGGDLILTNAVNITDGAEAMLRVLNDQATNCVLTLDGDWTSLGEASPITVGTNAVVRVSLQAFGTADTDIDAAAVLEN